MNIPKLINITQISGKHLIRGIASSRSITTSTEMSRRHKGSRNSDYGRLSKKPLKKRSGKDVQKQGHASEEIFFREQQKQQLKQLREALSNMKMTANKDRNRLKLAVLQPGLDNLKKRKTVSDIFDDIAQASKRKAKEEKDKVTADSSSSTGPKNTGK